MKEWLLQSIGIGGELTRKLDQVQWLWSRPVVLWVGLLLLIPAGLFIVARHRRNLPHVPARARAVLSACRIGVLLLLVVVLAGPYLSLREEVTRKPILAVVVDESASMMLPAGPFDPREAAPAAAAAGLAPAPGSASENASAAAGVPLDAQTRRTLDAMPRLQLAEHLLEYRADTLWQPLRERFDLRLYRMARSTRRVDPGALPEAGALPGGEADETNLGGALDHVLRDSAGKPLAAILLLSDGAATTGPDPADVLARQHGATARPVPLWAVPIGSHRPLPDLAVVDVLTQSQVAKDDTASVIVTLAAQGFIEGSARNAQVQLLDAQGQVLDQRPVSFGPTGREQVQLSFQGKSVGDHLLTVKVEALPEEQVRRNNEQTVAIRVSPDRLRVLYLEGAPRWDFRFLDHTLRRDQGLEATLVMEAALEAAGAAGADLPKAAGLPEDASGFAHYHAVILGDISPALLPRGLQEQLRLAVEEEGVGLIVQAGPRHMPAAFRDGPLAELLPVRPSTRPMSRDPVMRSGVQAPPYAPFQMKVQPAGAIHPALRLYDNATQNRRLWEHMPPFHWAADAQDPLPGATVLATFNDTSGLSPRPRPLIAEHFYGRGRVLLICTDSTYRWRRNIGNPLFDRFWGQALRHVAASEQRKGDRSWMEVYPARIEPGEAVTLELFALDRQTQPLRDPSLFVELTGQDFLERIEVPRTAQDGHYRGAWTFDRPGQYRLRFTDARGQTLGSAVHVASSGRELRRPGVDRDTLGNLAQTSGGGLLEIEELPRLPDLLQGEAQIVVVPHEASVWDNWITLLILCTFYCVDVGVRRLLGLT